MEWEGLASRAHVGETLELRGLDMRKRCDDGREQGIELIVKYLNLERTPISEMSVAVLDVMRPN